MKKIAIFMLLLFLTAFAEDYVVVNSMDGRDVLSGVFYANVKDLPVKFMPVTAESSIFAKKIGSNHDILLIQGAKPASTFIGTELQNRNNSLTLYSSADGGATNLDLANKSGAKKFIIVDSAYSDSALSVLPYAAMTDAYVILANRNNIGKVKDIVKDAENITIYGLVDSDVKKGLAAYNPQIIGKGEDKFEDNVIIVNKTMSEFSLPSLIMIDGASLEEGVAEGKQPILLSGKLTPQPTYNFIKTKVRNDELKSVLLIGNDLVVPAYDLRDNIEKDFEKEGLNKTFGIMVKFAQVVPSAGTGVLVLDTFTMPAYKPDLEIKEIVYNNKTRKLMASVENIGEGAAYYTMEIRVKVDGSDYQIFGTNATTLIERGNQDGSEYSLDLSSVAEGNVTAVALVKYGSSKKSLETFVSKQGPLTTISYSDTSNVTVQSAKYDRDRGSVMVTMKNSDNETAYAFSKIRLLLAGSPTNVSSAAIRTISAGSLIVEEFPLDLSDSDLEENQNITVFVDYGGRKGFLVKHAAYIVSLEDTGGFPLLLLVGIIALVLIAAISYYLMGKKTKKKR
jgi:hypothetical protein